MPVGNQSPTVPGSNQSPTVPGGNQSPTVPGSNQSSTSSAGRQREEESGGGKRKKKYRLRWTDVSFRFAIHFVSSPRPAELSQHLKKRKMCGVCLLGVSVRCLCVLVRLFVCLFVCSLFLYVRLFLFLLFVRVLLFVLFVLFVLLATSIPIWFVCVHVYVSCIILL